MKNKKSLVTGELQKDPIYVDDDLPPEDRAAQAKIREIARVKRSNGHEVRIAARKIRIDGEWLYWNETTNQFENGTFRSKDPRY